MSIAGLKKQFSKANQLLTEKVAGVRGSSLQDDFVEMERKVDVCHKLISEVIPKTQEFLQPNGAARAKLATVHTFNKLQGKATHLNYPQPEGQLGACLIKHGRNLGDSSSFGVCLMESGEAFRQLADIKYTLEDSVKQTFLEPLDNLQKRDIKQINHHRKKLEGHRLDFDCKKRTQEKGGKVTDEEIRTAQSKFEESKNLAECAMINFLESDVEHVQALHEFVSAELDYHRQAVGILTDLQAKIQSKKAEAQTRPRTDLSLRRSVIVDRNSWTNSLGSSTTGGHGGSEADPSSPTKRSSGGKGGGSSGFVMKGKYDGPSMTSQVPTGRALFDFMAESPSELEFQEGDVIKLIEQIDENWFFGELKGKQGHFPVNYIEVMVPLPN